MGNDLSLLPWADGQFHLVENYWEAVGVMTAIKAGIKPNALRRLQLAAEIGGTTALLFSDQITNFIYIYIIS